MNTDKINPFKENSINVDAKKNFCMSAIVKNNYGINYGTKEYYEIADLIAKENPSIFNSNRKTLNNSGKIDETFLYVGDIINLPNYNQNSNEEVNYDNLIDEYSSINAKNEELIEDKEKPSTKTGEELLKEAGIDIDFKIGYSKQNNKVEDGDCWLLTGLNALSYTEKGSEIIKDSMSINDDGSIDIYFKGIDTVYNVTLEEMQKYNETRFIGDDDVMAYEIATIKFREELLEGKTFGMDNSLNYCKEAYKGKEIKAGWAKTVWELFTGADFKGKETDGKTLENYFAQFQDAKNPIMSFHINEGSSKGDSLTTTIKNSNGETIKLYKNHAYAIKRVDENNVVIINPHNSAQEILIPKEELKTLANNETIYTDFVRLNEKWNHKKTVNV